jgi:hypothetical protein
MSRVRKCPAYPDHPRSLAAFVVVKLAEQSIAEREEIVNLRAIQRES